MQRNFLWIFFGLEDIPWAKEAPGGAPRGAQPTRACLEAQARPGGLCPPRVPPWTASLLYKYPNIPETLGESMKINSNRRRVKNHEIQSRALFRHSAGGEH